MPEIPDVICDCWSCGFLREAIWMPDHCEAGMTYGAGVAEGANAVNSMSMTSFSAFSRARCWTRPAFANDALRFAPNGRDPHGLCRAEPSSMVWADG